jgi:hypothetical protein
MQIRMRRQHVLDVFERLVGGVTLHLVESDLFDVTVLVHCLPETVGARLSIVPRQRNRHEAYRTRVPMVLFGPVGVPSTRASAPLAAKAERYPTLHAAANRPRWRGSSSAMQTRPLRGLGVGPTP